MSAGKCNKLFMFLLCFLLLKRPGVEVLFNSIASACKRWSIEHVGSIVNNSSESSNEKRTVFITLLPGYALECRCILARHSILDNTVCV